MILKPNITKLPVFTDSRGSLSFAEEKSQIPFNVHRTRWIYGVPKDYVRHEIAEFEMLLIAMCGNVELEVTFDGTSSVYCLNSPDIAVSLPRNAKVEMRFISPDAFLFIFEGDDSCCEVSVDDGASSEKKKADLSRCEIVEFPLVERIGDGGVVCVDNSSPYHFDVHRVYYMYNVPKHGSRGTHAHKILHHTIIPAAGRFRVTLWDGNERVKYVLDNPRAGLYVHPGVWNDLFDFSSGAVCMVLAHELFDSEDYLSTEEEYRDFLLS